MNRLKCIDRGTVPVLAGLCAGIAYWLTIPTWVVRCIFFALIFMTSGTMIPVYIVLACIIPNWNTIPEDYYDVSG